MQVRLDTAAECNHTPYGSAATGAVSAGGVVVPKLKRAPRRTEQPKGRLGERSQEGGEAGRGTDGSHEGGRGEAVPKREVGMHETEPGDIGECTVSRAWTPERRCSVRSDADVMGDTYVGAQCRLDQGRTMSG